MSIRLVHHLNVVTQKLEETRRFYVDVLGLREGWRPPFSSIGYWFYVDDVPIVHIQQADGAVTSSHVSALNHVAFEVDELDELLARLSDHGIAYQELPIAGTPIRQAFFDDPNGVRLEFTYAPAG